MTVKDLVLLYESSFESPNSQGTQVLTDQEQQGRPSTESTHIQREGSKQLPPPTPARFIKRTDARLNACQSPRKQSLCATQHPLSTTHLTTSHDYGREPLLKNSRSSLPNSFNTLAQPLEQESLAQLIYLPSLASNAASPLKGPSLSHKPVPAQTIFARNACPLSLPKLDECLALLPPPDFHGVVRDSHEGMFLPMEKLAKVELSLDDLENNSSVAPFWRDRTLIFGRSLTYLLALLVCESSHINNLHSDYIQGSSAIAPYYSLQGLINFVQIFALILSTIGKNFKRLKFCANTVCPSSASGR